MIHIGIISKGKHQQLYYLIKSIRKQFGDDYTIDLFENGLRLYNVVDNMTKHDNVENPNFWMFEHYEDNILILKENCLLTCNLSEYNKQMSYNLGNDCYYYPPIIAKDDKVLYENSNEIANAVVWYNEHEDYVTWLYKHTEYWKFSEYDLIVAMTQWAGRINEPAFYECLDRLINQQCKWKYKIVICLSNEELHGEYPARLHSYEHKDFEILWTEKNTRPLKKYDPINEKYPDVPLMCMDDDDICELDAVESMYNIHLSDPWSAYGTWIEDVQGVAKWLAGLRIWPPHCMYQFPLEDYYKYFYGILDDNFNVMRCLFKMTPCKKAPAKSVKRNDNDKVLGKEYAHIKWEECYNQFLDDHIYELPQELFYD